MMICYGVVQAVKGKWVGRSSKGEIWRRAGGDTRIDMFSTDKVDYLRTLCFGPFWSVVMGWYGHGYGWGWGDGGGGGGWDGMEWDGAFSRMF